MDAITQYLSKEFYSSFTTYLLFGIRFYSPADESCLTLSSWRWFSILSNMKC